VIELMAPNKSKALNAGDEAAIGFPRIYLDADIYVTTHVARALSEALTRGNEPLAGGTGSHGPLGAVPRRDLDLTGRPLLVRGYFAISRRLPVFRDGLFGRGMIAVSAEGRARFGQFPEMIADDLFLDSQFSRTEKCQVSEVATVVAAPRRTRHLVRRLVRVRRGNTAMRAAARAGLIDVSVREADRLSWFRDVVVPNPRLLPAAFAYVAISASAALLARREPDVDNAWGRDNSTRGDSDTHAP
jgi:hypothetical protein